MIYLKLSLLGPGLAISKILVTDAEFIAIFDPALAKKGIARIQINRKE